jgi:hypothetical protein
MGNQNHAEIPSRAGQAVMNASNHPRKSHCCHGHLRSPENVGKSGSCRKCLAENHKAYAAAHKEEFNTARRKRNVARRAKRLGGITTSVFRSIAKVLWERDNGEWGVPDEKNQS